MSPKTARPLLRIFSPISLIAACFLAYWNTLGAGFTYDAHFIVESNLLIRSLSVIDIFSAPFWQGFVTEGGGTYYRPFTILTYAMDFALSGLDPYAFHLTNLLLHTGTTLLVLQLGRRLIRSERAALFGAILFAVHPVHTEAVSSVAGRSDILVGLFFVSTLLVFSAVTGL
jgi:hypothetical protein